MANVRWLAILLLGCSSEPSEPTVLATELFECGAPTPDRRSPVPLSCMLDPWCTERLIVGHRGAGGSAGLYAPENSLASVRFAILAGLDVIEIDVRHTSDDRIVVMHDAELERTTGDERLVSSTTFAEATALPLISDGYPGDFSCERVPSFLGVLALAKDKILLDVDTKTDRADLVVQEIMQAGMLDQAFVSAGDLNKLERARTTSPDVRLQARPDTLEAYEEIRNRLARPPEIVEVPIGALEAFAPVVIEHDGKLFTNVFIQDFVAYAEADLSVYTDAYERGAQVLQSEFPTFVVDALERRPWDRWPPHRTLELGTSPLLD